MNITQVSICPSDAARRAGRPALTPELLAATGARYSRNNEGLEAILAKIDPSNLEKSVDSIFRMVDYGHQSIADMTPVAMFIDGVSIWLAYYIWTLCPTAGGQESSTRYLRMAVDGLVPADSLGISDAPAWRDSMGQAFQAYHTALAFWERQSESNPALMGIPRSLLDDPSEAARRKVARMRRNYAFDRARYFLPVAAATNLMLVMSARGWVNLCQHLLSHPLPEPRQAGERIVEELALSAPRMTRHAKVTDAVRQSMAYEFGKLGAQAEADGIAKSAEPFLEVATPQHAGDQEWAAALSFHPNRYAPLGSDLQRMSVRFGWSAIGFAEIRDLNRHRTGTKYCPLVPQGFYGAMDQAPAGTSTELTPLITLGAGSSKNARSRLRTGDPAYVYWTLLGTEFPFEHLTTADKFIYEAELRTGVGAHYRYARHLRDVLALWYDCFPSTKGLLLEGSAEPE